MVNIICLYRAILWLILCICIVQYCGCLSCSDSQTANARDDSAADGVDGRVTPVNSCISSYDVSSNKVDAHKYDTAPQ